MKPTPHEMRLAEARQAYGNVKKMEIAHNNASDKLAHMMQRRDEALGRRNVLEDRASDLQAQMVARLGDDSVTGMPADIRTEWQALRAEIEEASAWLAACETKVVNAQVIHSASLNGLNAAKTALKLAVEEVGYLRLERDAIEAVEEFDRAAAKLERIRLAAGRGLDIPIDVSRRIFPDKVRAALHRLPEPDRIHTPVNVLRGEVPHVDPWKELRAQILAELEEEA